MTTEEHPKVSIDYIRDMINDALMDIPIEIERIKNSDLKDSTKADTIAFKEGMQCAYKIIQKCL